MACCAPRLRFLIECHSEPGARLRVDEESSLLTINVAFMRFAKIVFLIAGIYGIVVIAPQYGMEDVNRARPARPSRTPSTSTDFSGCASRGRSCSS
jgi:hypothetical protein